jgi:hypothetical protein
MLTGQNLKKNIDVWNVHSLVKITDSDAIDEFGHSAFGFFARLAINFGNQISNLSHGPQDLGRHVIFRENRVDPSQYTRNIAMDVDKPVPIEALRKRHLREIHGSNGCSLQQV